VAVSTSNELLSVVWVEFDFKDLSLARVTKGNGPAFGPVENLERKCFINSNRNYVLSIFAERYM